MQTAKTKIEKQAIAYVAMGLVTKSNEGYTVATPSVRGQNFEYQVIGGKCDCFYYEENEDCPHVRAAEIKEANDAAEVLPVAPADGLQLAAQQALNETFLSVAGNADLGGKWWNAFEKAEKEISKNDTISYAGGVLKMRSRGTGINYKVTKDACQCKAFGAGSPCYHRAIHLILEKQSALVPANVVVGNFGKKEAVKFSDPCGCVFNFDDKFTEKYCELHASEMAEINEAAAYHWSHAA